MAAANESQGLKIAVAAFITLTVILTVSSYFLYSNGAAAEAQRQQAEENASVKNKAAGDALNRYDEMRNRIGVKAGEFEPAKEEITAHLKKMDERLNAFRNRSIRAVQKAQPNGAKAPSSKTPSKTCKYSLPRFDPSPTRRTSPRSTAWPS